MLDLANKRIVVAGLGQFGGGVAAARWLVEQGARVLVTDKLPAEKLAESIEQLDGLPIEFRLGKHREADFTSADLVVASPAIPPHNPYLLAAKAAGVPISTEIRLFVERCPATVIGVTGTKGKSTTASMLGAILRRHFTTFLGGNLGGSLLLELRRIDKTHLVVLELSSFMLDYLGAMSWSPHIAVVTLIAPDHTEWHGSHEAYVDAKRNVVRFQRPDDFAVVNEDCPAAAEFGRHTRGRVVAFGAPGRDGRRAFSLAVEGAHNQVNAQGAFAAAAQLGVTWDDAQAALHDYHALPHRLQLVHEENGVRFYDDSIATVPEAAIAALEAFEPRRVLQIVGGSSKGLKLTALCGALADRAKAVFCIGATGPHIADALGESPGHAAAPAYRCGDLATAVRLAREQAQPGDIVLLSPGCASYDQFTNFEQRGTEFVRLVKQLG